MKKPTDVLLGTVAPGQGSADPQKAGYIRALEADAADAGAWYGLGLLGGGVVGGERFDAKSCYVRCLELDEKMFEAWLSLGDLGGGTVGGVFYDAEVCKGKLHELVVPRPRHGNSVRSSATHQAHREKGAVSR